ncbi:SDR family NAD(P)-dependent oxidoreductase [Brevibacillus dissolubilis]|uniref:SDR family NAD(P)-dependent oxidoreductase n=1 Tax=Brevibacillus dissolubilis TaxID=1844116 RepID=UPI001117884B|nr:SDR family NAD(P)-dependent oxidoreductase [Brevibacillus dissolubilis]
MMKSPTKETFVQRVTHSNYIVSDHRVHGVCTLPGVTLLDLVYRLSLPYLGTQAIELRHIIFKQPIVTTEQFDQNVYVTFTPDGSQWRVSVTSQKVKGDEIVDSQADENMECFLTLREAFQPAKPTLDVQAFTRQAIRQYDMDEIYGLARQVDITHYTFMKTLGTVYQRNHEELMKLHLSELAESFLDKFYAHAAFLDGSTLAGNSFSLGEAKDGVFRDHTPYIPFMVERFCIHKPLPSTIYTYSQKKQTASASVASTPPDIVSMDIIIFDESGEALVEFGRLTAKRIREPHLIQKLTENKEQPHRAENGIAEQQPILGEQAQADLGHSSNPPFATDLESPSHPADATDSSQPDPTAAIHLYLQQEIAGVLGKTAGEIDIHTGFYDLGLDSTELLGLVKVLEQKVQAQLYPTLLFEYPTVVGLGEYLLENWEKAFAVVDVPAQGQPQGQAGAQNHAHPQTHANDSAQHTDTDRNHSPAQTLFFTPVWNKEELTADLNQFPGKQHDSNQLSGAKRFRHIVILLDHALPALPQAIQQQSDDIEVVRIDSSAGSIPARFTDQFKQLLALVQKQLRQKLPTELLVQVVADADLTGEYAYALAGFLKTAHLENPKIHSQIITMDRLHAQSAPSIAQLLEKEALAHKKGMSEIRYQSGASMRYTKRLQETDWQQTQTKAVPACKENGVYVITGGLGGLGLMVANHFAHQAKVKLALLGRSKLDQTKEEKLQELRQKGAEVLYLEADISNESDLAITLSTIKSKLGPITGVLHCAGILKDQFIIQKDPADVQAVFEPKVQGIWNLDKATQQEKLDFFVIFSSISAILGNLGQADYSSANAFLDGFAAQRQEKVNRNECYGNTFSINWPLWSEGGMHVDAEMEQMMYASTGMLALPTGAGMDALDAILAQDQTQIAVMHGNGDKIRDHVKAHLVAKNPADRAETERAETKRAETDRAETKRPATERGQSRTPASQPSTYDQEDIAIIGVSGRYPSANNLEEFYQNLRAGKDCITGFPKDRWKDYEFTYDVEQFYQYGGFIDGIDQFDPLFFNISPSQAETMDPQARLFLETAWEACEDAGFFQDRTRHHYPSSSDRSVGVFAGVFWNHYELYAAEMTLRGTPTSFGVTPATIPNMVSYCMNFHGPSMAVDTMCSSSLTAIHLAAESIKKGECHYAIAGGVNLVTHPHKYMFLNQAQFLASDGRCRSFGMDGDGYVPGEGVGAVLMTTLSHAEQEGYHIYAVIKGSAINHVGKTSGATVPDPVAQSEVIADAIRKAGIHPSTISYMEAHGTGTSLGDPIEIQGLKRSFDKWGSQQQTCAIGSLKSNIGHLEAAAGIAGLTKLLLQFKYQCIFPSLHAERLNPFIPFADTPFYVEREYKAWKRPEVHIDGPSTVAPRRAGLSSFGANGSNAHIIVEEYIPRAIRQEKSEGIVQSGPVIVPLSAKHHDSLKAYARKLHHALAQQPSESLNLIDVAYTLQVGREPMRYRAAFVVHSIAELIDKLRLFMQGEEQVAGVYLGDIKQSQEWSRVSVSDQDLLDAAKCATAWVHGASLDWNKLYGDMKPQRVSLPAYPFVKGSYWVQAPKAKSSDGVNSGTKIGAEVAANTDARVAAKTSNPTAQTTVTHTHPDPSAGTTIMLAPVWETVPLQQGSAFPSTSDRIVMIGGTEQKRNEIRNYYPNAHTLDIHPYSTVEEISQKIEAFGPIDHIVWMASASGIATMTDEGLIKGQDQGVIQVYRIIKSLLRLGYANQELGWTLLTVQTQPIRNNDPVNPIDASLHGLIGSMAKEYTNWKVRLVDLEANREWPLAELFTILADSQGNPWVYRDSVWYRQELVQVQHELAKQPFYRTGGVYVVIGGAGGIGEVWSEYMIRTYQAHIIWIGRRPLDADIQAKLNRLATLGPAPVYLSADATDQAALDHAYRQIKQRHPQIHGVIQSAIVLMDRSLANMEEDRFRAVLASKVDVSVRVAQVFQHEPLDFVMFFSSLNAFLKGAGQSNYVAGCTFKDAFAHQLSQEWSCAVKVMNWGYWGSVGIVATDEYTERMNRLGIGSIEPAEAMEALEVLLGGTLDQFALMKITKPLQTHGLNPEKQIILHKRNPQTGIPSMNAYKIKHDKRAEYIRQQLNHKIAEMNDVLSRLLLAQLQSMGMFTQGRAGLTVLKNVGGLQDSYLRWLEESLDALVRNQHLKLEQDTYTAADPTPLQLDEVWREWDQKKVSWSEDRNMKAQVILVEATLRALPDILTGKTRATDIMFPNSSMELVGGIYK